MRNKIFYFLTACLGLMAHVEAGYTIKNGKIVDAAYSATLPAQDHYNLGLAEIDKQNWMEAAKQFRIVTTSYPNSTYASDAYFYLGVAEYELEEMDFANQALTTYLKTKNNPKYFHEAIEYKFGIAEKLNEGYKKRFFGTKKMPKWASGKSLAIEIYDEVVASLPCHDLAAKALYSKGALLPGIKRNISAL